MSLVDLSGGERVLLRRALVLYSQGWMAQKVAHKGDPYNASYDQQRIDACDQLGDKLRLAGPPAETKHVEGVDPLVANQKLAGALREIRQLVHFQIDPPHSNPFGIFLKESEELLLQMGEKP